MIGEECQGDYVREKGKNLNDFDFFHQNGRERPLKEIGKQVPKNGCTMNVQSWRQSYEINFVLKRSKSVKSS